VAQESKPDKLAFLDAPADKPIAPRLPTRDAVPPELPVLKRWLLWDYTWLSKKKEWTKQPMSPRTGEWIGVTPVGREGQDWASHFADFDTAILAAARRKLNIGFVFVEGDGFCGVDFDKPARDRATGEMRESLKPWIANLDTYAEVSPSGGGYHAICKATLPGPGNKQPLPEDVLVKCEMYDSARFFTFTGIRLEGKPLEIRSIQPEINALHEHVFASVNFNRPLDPTPTGLAGYRGGETGARLPGARDSANRDGQTGIRLHGALPVLF